MIKQFLLYLELNPNASELVSSDPRFGFGQEVGEYPYAVEDAQMVCVEAETHFQFPGVEDVIHGSS